MGGAEGRRGATDTAMHRRIAKKSAGAMAARPARGLVKGRALIVIEADWRCIKAHGAAGNEEVESPRPTGEG